MMRRCASAYSSSLSDSLILGVFASVDAAGLFAANIAALFFWNPEYRL